VEIWTNMHGNTLTFTLQYFMFIDNCVSFGNVFSSQDFNTDMAASSGILGETDSVILVYIHHLECWQARSMTFQITAAVYSQKGDYFLDITAFCAVFERNGMTVCTKKSAVVFASLCLWVRLSTPSLFSLNTFIGTLQIILRAWNSKMPHFL